MVLCGGCGPEERVTRRLTYSCTLLSSMMNQVQEMVLEKPVLFLGGTIVLVLMGAAQRQTLSK